MTKLILSAVAATAVLAACARSAGDPAASTGPAAAPAGVTATPAASTAAPAAPATPTAADGLRDRLMAAGFGVPTEPLDADDFSLASLSGTTVKLSDHRGKLVFLNFWATWCPPCRSEMPSMEALYGRFKDQGFVILAVDLQEPKDTVRKYVKDNGFTFPVLLDADGVVGATWGAQSIPTTYLVGRDGSILARHIGAREWDTDEMFALFEAMLAAN